MSVRAKRGGPVDGNGRGDGGGGSTHPLQLAIEKLYAAGKTPRIRVDARRNDVVVPVHVRDRWKESLVIDLDAGYPLNLQYEASALHCDLAFAGHVSRCTFSWPSIYGVFDRASGQGIEIASHRPPAVLPEALRREEKPEPPKLRSLSSRAETAPAKSADTSTSAETATAKGDDTPKRQESASDELAKARRAKFRVIPGG